MRLQFLIIISIFFTLSIKSQCLLIETSLKNLTKQSHTIIEGQVGSSFSTWDQNQNLIYTLHEVNVYGKFKGERNEKIYIATLGGIVGDRMLKVNPELELNEENLGIFFLNETNDFEFLNLQFKVFVPSFNAQSFFKYDEISNSVNGVFKNYILDSKELDREIESITNESYVKIKKLNLVINKNDVGNSRMITSFSPTTVTGGTFTTITINGSGFGATKGTVRFTNSTGGPGTYGRVFQQDILTWNNTQIVVRVPSFAGTGLIWVKTFSGTDYLSSTMLTVRFAEVTAAQNGDSVQIQTRLTSRSSNLGKNTFSFNTTLFNTSGAPESFSRALKNWVCSSNVNWNISTSTTSSNSSNGSDNINLVFFDSSLSGSTIGRAYSWYSSCTPVQIWYTIDLDLGFNPSTNWHYGAGQPSSSQTDFESVALHELGHLHQLGHVIDDSKVMNRSISQGDTRRTLSAEEVEGAVDVYSRSIIQGTCTGSNFNPMTFAPNVMVVNTNDSGAGSLRQAIVDVCPNDTITMGISANSTITLTSSELTIDKNMKIHGLSQSTFNLSGNNARRIFNIQSGKTLSLQSMKLINTTSTTNGGAIYNNGTLNLKNITFQNNFQSGVRKAFTSPTGTSVNLESSIIINN